MKEIGSQELRGTEIDKVMKLEGLCNCCGLCCVRDELRCEYLEVIGEIGQPEATRCRVWPVKYNRMPIRMLNKDGQAVEESVCYVESLDEKMAILERGIGKGCSLQVKVNI